MNVGRGFIEESRQSLLIFICMSVLSALYVHPVHDPDFWWHLASGRWTAEQFAIPTDDMLSFSTREGIGPEHTARIRYLLTQYLLSQPLFFILWKWLGPTGIILLRASVLSVSSAFVARFLMKKGVSSSVALSLAMIAGLHLVYFSGERPQLFSFLFSVLYVYEIGALKDGRNRGIATIPLLSLIWANTHSTALMSWFLGAFFLADSLLRYYRKGDKREKIAFCSIAAGLACTLFNPTTYHVLPLFLETLGSKHVSLNTEYMSPIEQFLELGRPYAEFWTLAALAVLMLFSSRTTYMQRIILIALLAAALKGVRFTPFFVLLSPMFFGEGLEKAIKDTHKKIASASLTVLAILLTITHLYSYRGELFTFGVFEKDYPKAGISFLREKGITGRMFNFFEWGGYIEWHMPETETFIDSRALRLDIYDEYYAALRGSISDPYWADIMTKYRIDFIFLPYVSPASGEPTALVYLLLRDPVWKPVFADDLSVVFVKREHQAQPLDNDLLLDRIILSLKEWSERDPKKAIRWSRLAAAYYQKGDRQNALDCYKKAGALDPSDQFIAGMVRTLER